MLLEEEGQNSLLGRERLVSWAEKNRPVTFPL